MQTVLKIFLIQVCICITGFTTTAQTTNIDTLKLNAPGPANIDTTKYSTFYLIRPDGEVAKNYWLGIYFNDAQMVRANNDMRYVIKYAGTGDVEVWTRNDQKTSVNVHAEAGKTYYLQLTIIPGGKIGYPQLNQLNEAEGRNTFDKIISSPIYIYDPDPFTNGYYILPSEPKVGYAHMKFSLPLSTRHFFENVSSGFNFSYYDKNVSATFSEADGVYGSKINFKNKDDFEKFAEKGINNIKKGFKKSETLQSLTEDSLSSTADYIHTIYFVTTDTKPAVQINGQYPVLELRQYSTIIYKKDAATGKGDYYTIFFSERGLPEELHSKEEIRFKMQQLLNSCVFGDFKN